MDSYDINDVKDVLDIVKWNSPQLDDLNKYVQNYKQFFPYGTWFRGQEDATWPLVPSVFRKSVSNELIYALDEPLHSGQTGSDLVEVSRQIAKVIRSIFASLLGVTLKESDYRDEVTK